MTDPTKNKEVFSDYSAKAVFPALTDLNDLHIELTVPHHCIGLRLDQALAKLLPNWSRSRLQSWIVENKVTVNGQATSPKQKMWGNEKIQISPQYCSAETDHAAEDIKLTVIYEDDLLIVVNKPVGMVVHPGNGNWQGTMLNALLYHASQLSTVPRAGIVHRLDKDTSGLLVVAKTIEAQTNLVRQLQQRSVKRDYLALVLGHVEQNGYVDAPIGRHPVHRTKMAITGKGKQARTHYQILTHFEGCTLLQCSLETGRTHQIRVHMQSIGHALVGDPVYSGKPKKIAQEIGQIITRFTRQALHAQQLELKHPQDGQTMKWEAAVPDDMDDLLQKLREQSN